MGQIQNTFRRFEIKYLVDREEKGRLMELIRMYTCPDEYGRSTICNLYYDTPDRLLIRRSLEKPVYKEKLRVRSYGPVSEDGAVFVELKKKYNGVVYKRRVCMTEAEAAMYLAGGTLEKRNQIINEIDYFISYYKGIAPAAYISYEREAFFGRSDNQLRITFDDNILWRETELSLVSEVSGEPLLPEGRSLMEIKLASGMPLWLSHELNSMKVFNTSFSKYGSAYLTMLSDGEEGRFICA